MLDQFNYFLKISIVFNHLNSYIFNSILFNLSTYLDLEMKFFHLFLLFCIVHRVLLNETALGNVVVIPCIWNHPHLCSRPLENNKEKREEDTFLSTIFKDLYNKLENWMSSKSDKMSPLDIIISKGYLNRKITRLKLKF